MAALNPDSSDDDDDFKSVAEADFRKIQEKAKKEGFVDGVEAAKESVFQKSFDLGWKDGLRTAFELEKYKSFCETILSLKQMDENSELIDEAKIFMEKFNKDLSESDHCLFTKHKEDHPLENISEMQTKYVNDKLNELSENLPNITKLLTAASRETNSE